MTAGVLRTILGRGLVTAAVATVVAAGPTLAAAEVQAPVTPVAQVECGEGHLQVPNGVTNPENLLGTVPIVMVHGITDSGALWSKPALDGGPTLAQKLDALPGTSVWAFDYHAASIEWVTDPRIGPALADAIGCLSRATGNKVVVVAHSMGGLATEYAAGQGDVAGQIAQISTIGTPFDGSASLTAVAALLQETETPVSDVTLTLAKVILGYCTKLNRESYAGDDGFNCDVAGVPGSPVGQALQVGSDEIAALPPWPAQVPTFRVAGDMYLYPLGRGIYGHLPGLPLRVGDVAVAVESALSPRVQGPTLTIRCDAVGSDMMSVRCMHSVLPLDREVIDKVYAQIEPVVQAAAVPGDGGTASTGDFENGTYDLDCFGMPPTAYEETPRSAPSGPGPTRRYQLSEGQYHSSGSGDGDVSMQLVKVEQGDFDGDGAPEAAALIECQGVSDHVEENDFLFAFDGSPQGWRQVGSPLTAYYVIREGDRFASYDVLNAPEDRLYKKTVWQMDASQGFVAVAHGPVDVTQEQLPQDPERLAGP